MRRESSEQVAAIARQRLEQLGREMGRVAPAVVREPGRHSRSRAPGPGGRISAWRERALPELAGSIRLRARHLAVLASVALIALAITGWWTMRGSAAPVPVAPAITESEARTAAASPVAARPSPAADPAAPASPAAVVVDIAGKVRRPGVATLPAGSRVIDALRKAGGARPGVDLSTLNLARVLVDGEQILVGARTSPAAVAAPDEPAPGADAAGGATVNINTAGVSELDALPGVGPVTAQKIVDWRSEHGTFTAIDELLEVDGIGPKTLADLAPRATL